MKSDVWGYRIHDGAAAFRFELQGKLAAQDVAELDQCWRTAASTIAGKALVVDVHALTGMDDAGRELLHRWGQAGAKFVDSKADRTAGRGRQFLQSAIRISIAVLALLLLATVWADSGRSALAPAATASK